VRLAPILIPSPVLDDEVEQLTRRQCAALKLTIIQPTFAQLTAATQRRGGLSFYDHLGLIITHERSATCVTNDGHLYRECESENIPVMRGLRPLILLVQSADLTMEHAIAAVSKMQSANPRFITQKIVDDFIAQIGG
jgi:hypothetical protein